MRIVMQMRIIIIKKLIFDFDKLTHTRQAEIAITSLTVVIYVRKLRPNDNYPFSMLF